MDGMGIDRSVDPRKLTDGWIVGGKDDDSGLKYMAIFWYRPMFDFWGVNLFQKFDPLSFNTWKGSPNRDDNEN